MENIILILMAIALLMIIIFNAFEIINSICFYKRLNKEHNELMEEFKKKK